MTLADDRPAAPTGRFGSFDLALYAATVFGWSTSWLAVKNQLGVVAPEVSVVWRFLIAAALMGVWVAVAGLPWRFPWTVHLRFLALGALIFSTNFTLVYYGAQYLPSGLVSVVFSLASVFNLIIAAVIARRRPEGAVLFGGLCGFAGVALMFWPQVSAAEFGRDAGLGLALCLAGTLVFCAGNLVSGANQRAGIPVLSANAWGMVYGAGLLAGYSALNGSAFVIEPTARYLGSLLWLAVISTVLAFWAYLTLLGRIGAARAGYTTVMFPVAALAISTVAEDYRWTWPAVAGLVLVLIGNVFVLKRGSRP